MPANRQKLSLIISLAMLLILACVNTGHLDPVSKPTRSLTITFEESQRREFCKRLQTFADKNGFDFNIQGMDADRNCHVVQLSQKDNNPYIVVEDFGIFDEKPPEDPEPTRVNFFIDDPDSVEAKETLDALVDDLITLINVNSG